MSSLSHGQCKRRKQLSEMSSRHLRRLIRRECLPACAGNFIRNDHAHTSSDTPVPDVNSEWAHSLNLNSGSVVQEPVSFGDSTLLELTSSLNSDMNVDHEESEELDCNSPGHDVLPCSAGERGGGCFDEGVINHEQRYCNEAGNNAMSCETFGEGERYSGESDSENENVNDSIESEIASWAVRRGITHSALRDLLGILQKHQCHSNLPADPRTLLKTPKVTPVRTMPPGQFGYCGVGVGLKQLLTSRRAQTLYANKQLRLMINVDGVPISKSSTSVLWPILCSVTGSSEVFMIACYHGYEKPKDANDFLAEFVEEMSDLIANGLDYGGDHYEVFLHAIICDAPAKSFLLNVKGHSGYFSCTKCTEEGDYLNHRMCFHELNALLRTDENFKTRLNEDYHSGRSILENVPNIGLVSNVPLDYMHLVLLGVQRKLLSLWLGGELQVRLPKRTADSIALSLQNLAEHIPSEFQRKPGPLHSASSWKATECRLFLLYLGPIVLNEVFPDQRIYDNFMALHVAISILVSGNLVQQHREYANELLKYFVQSFKIIYGRHLVSHNVHGLIHLAKDVERFGPLDSFSAFRFENFNQFLKNQKRKSDKPLQQILRRAVERQSLAPQGGEENSDGNVTLRSLKSTNHCGPLVQGCRNPQYRAAFFQDFTISVSKGNSCCGLKDGKIVTVQSIAHCVLTNDVVIIGYQMENLEPLFTVPCSSQLLGSFKCSAVSSVLEFWPLSSVRIKYMQLPLNPNSHALLPLLHVST